MKTHIFLITGIALSAAAAWAQTSIPLNTVPSRIVGHPPPETVSPLSLNPNLIEGREFYAPEGVALDTSVNPHILYVADAVNNRVLAWKDGLGFANGQKADLVIGQQDFYHTSAQGPSATFQSGLSGPNGIVTDSSGNLYVVDSFNNRVLRYPKPFDQFAKSGSIFPDMWIGQPSLGTNSANFGSSTPNDQGLNLASSSYPVNIALDAQNNLWVVDPGNRRVLEFTADSLTQAQQSGFSGLHASVVIGQADFTSNNLPAPTATNIGVLNAFATPVAIAFDAAGNLFVSDYSSTYRLGRVLVFQPPFISKQSAARIMGIPNANFPVGQVGMGLPSSIFFIPSNQSMGVVDTGDSRILQFDSFDSGKWPATGSPAATAVYGQQNFTSVYGNGGTSAFVPAPSASTLNSPTAAIYSEGQVFVADSLNNRVLVLPLTAGAFPAAATQLLGQDTFSMSAPNLIEGREFDFYPGASTAAADAGVAIDTSSPTPHLYVSDPHNHRVLGYNDFRTLAAGGRADLVIGQPDFNSGLCNISGNPSAPNASSLCYPTGLAVDPQGNLYVADTLNSRVLRFPAPFNHQGGLQSADLVLGQHQFTFSIPDPTSSTMAEPYGLALSDNNGLLVSDITHNRVLFFRFTGNDTFDGSNDSGISASKVFGQQDFNSRGAGSSNTQFSSPHHIATDNEARLYVADTVNNRIMIFDHVNGDLTPATGAQATFQITGVTSPRSVFVNPTTSEIWVGDNTSVVKKYPIYQNLINQSTVAPIAGVSAPGTAIALAQDQYGDLVVADATNRVGFYFPAADPVNGGSFLPSCVSGPSNTCRRLAPGTLASICSQGSQCDPASTLPLFGSGPATAISGDASSFPLPRVLGDTRVDINWTNADGSQTTQSTPLYYVSPTQINFVVPMAAPQSGTANVTVVQDSTGRVYAAGVVALAPISPAIMMREFTGTLRQAAVINLADGTINSTTNPAARGSSVSIYATGQGFVPGAPDDGALMTNPNGIPAPVPLRVNINGLYLDQMNYDSSSDIPKGQWLEYSGLNYYPGLWQINIYIPHAVAPGTQIPLIITANQQTNTAPGTFVMYINVK